MVVEGYHVASGPSKDYPYGALDRQRPIFKSRGLDLAGYFNGTLNIDISPLHFRLVRAEITFRQVQWTDLHPPEDFSFSRCMVVHAGVEYDGWVYYPHPETKLRHFQDPSLLEVIARPILSIQYGDKIEVRLNEEEIEVLRP
jgi:CTP-dependent riboflavin kinase